MNAHPLFNDMDFKESEGGAECFPRMQITLKQTIVNFSIDPENLLPISEEPT